MTVLIAVQCPDCHSTDVVKHGRSGEGKQRYGCQNPECPRRTFIRQYTYQGCRKDVKKKIPQMLTNGSGIRDTARVLNITTDTVMSELKKKKNKS
jgi:transposase-like protein